MNKKIRVVRVVMNARRTKVRIMADYHVSAFNRKTPAREYNITRSSLVRLLTVLGKPEQTNSAGLAWWTLLN